MGINTVILSRNPSDRNFSTLEKIYGSIYSCTPIIVPIIVLFCIYSPGLAASSTGAGFPIQYVYSDASFIITSIVAGAMLTWLHALITLKVDLDPELGNLGRMVKWGFHAFVFTCEMLLIIFLSLYLVTDSGAGVLFPITLSITAYHLINYVGGILLSENSSKKEKIWDGVKMISPLVMCAATFLLCLDPIYYFSVASKIILTTALTTLVAELSEMLVRYCFLNTAAPLTTIDSPSTPASSSPSLTCEINHHLQLKSVSYPADDKQNNNRADALHPEQTSTTVVQNP